MDKEAEKRQIEYISSQRKDGFSDEAIKTSLLKVGWSEEEIDKGFSKVNGHEFSNQNPSFDYENKKTKTSDSQKKESFVRVLGFALMATFVLAGISAVLFYFLYFSETTLDKMSKEEKIANAFFFQEEFESTTMNTEMNLSIEEMFNFGLSADLYISNDEKITDFLMSALFNMDVMFKEKGLTFEADTEVETRLVEGVYYVRINKVPEIPFSAEDLSFFEGKWMHINLLEELSEQDIKEIENQFSSIKESNKKRHKDWINYLEFIQKNEFLKISELNKNRNNYTYKLEFDIEKIPTLLRDIADNFPEKPEAKTLREIALEIERNWVEFEKIVIMKDGYILPVVVEIDRKTGYLLGLHLDLEFKVVTGDMGEFLSGEEDQFNVKFSLQNTFSDFGKEKKVDIPENSASFEEVMSEKVSEEGGSFQQKRATDASIKSELGQMRAQAYLYSADTQSYTGVCTDENMGLLNLYTSVQERTNGYSECNDSADQWASWAQLVGSDDFWCVDYRGFLGELTTEPVSGDTECPTTSEEAFISNSFNLSSLFLFDLKDSTENFRVSNFQDFFQALVSEVIKTK